MENKIEQKLIIASWSIYGFLIFLGFKYIKVLILDLILTIGMALKISPGILQYYDLLANSIVIIALLLIAIVIFKIKKIDIKQTTIDFPIKLAKKTGLIVLILYLLTIVLLIIRNNLFLGDYNRFFEIDYNMIYSNHLYFDFGFNIIELVIILIMFVRLLKLITKE